MLKRLGKLLSDQPDVRREGAVYKVNAGATTYSADSLSELEGLLRARAREMRELRTEVAFEPTQLDVRLAGTVRVAGAGRHDEHIRNVERALAAVQVARAERAQP